MKFHESGSFFQKVGYFVILHAVKISFRFHLHDKNHHKNQRFLQRWNAEYGNFAAYEKSPSSVYCLHNGIGFVESSRNRDL